MSVLRLGSNNLKEEFDEKARLLHNSPLVVPLLPEHLDNAFESLNAAFKNDPMSLYLAAGKERSSIELALHKRVWILVSKRQLKKTVNYTVDAGDAVIVSEPPETDIGKPSPIDRAIDSTLDMLQKVYATLNRSEASKRTKEARKKEKKVLEKELGNRTKEMVHVELLATKPEKQGHGFGTALLDTVLFSVDIHGRSAYLFSSNIANVPYYESFGFVRIAHVALGDDNPKWKKDPVIIPLMVREPKI